MFKDFKTFIARGNVIDLAVGVIIGGAFGKIVSSLVNDLLMPIIGVISGGVNFSGLHIRIGGTNVLPINITYGNFIQSAIDFLIVAVTIFLVIRLLGRVKKPAANTNKLCPRCYMEIALQATRCPNCTSELGTV